MLTCRAAKCILRFLPNELLTEIIANAAPADQVALCRVSKLFSRLVHRVLYRTITLALPRAVLLALLVKSFDISASKLNGTHIHPLDLISAALACTTNLETLNFIFARGASPFIECIDSRTFPALRCLVLRADLDAEPALLAFLHRHPLLGVLKLFGPAEPFAALLSTIGMPCLLDLNYLKATAAVFPVLLATSGSSAPLYLTAAEIDWKLVGPLDALPPLRALTAHSASLTKLVCFCSGPNLDLIPLVAQNFPRLVVLKVHASSGLLSRAHDAETLTTIRTALAHLSTLCAFQYTDAHFRFSIAHREHDRATIASWATSCPALRQCTLNGHIWKRCAATGE
ncbi:hypothetical protein C8J57DRAFT_1365456 [Mycena rebaudengoi]|nr:hypothetical protein C8J57DRAFT_1365456 [Mycena rebaudengoi]